MMIKNLALWLNYNEITVKNNVIIFPVINQIFNKLNNAHFYFSLRKKVASYTVTTAWPENEKYINSNSPLIQKIF